MKMKMIMRMNKMSVEKIETEKCGVLISLYSRNKVTPSKQPPRDAVCTNARHKIGNQMNTEIYMCTTMKLQCELRDHCRVCMCLSLMWCMIAKYVLWFFFTFKRCHRLYKPNYKYVLLNKHRRTSYLECI